MNEQFVVYRTVNGKKEELETVSSILWAADVIETNIKSDHLKGEDAEYQVERKEMVPLG